MHISEAGLKLIEEFEGFRAERYDDSVGVPTIGFGTTAGAGVVDPLPETCTEAEAENWLKEYVERDVEPAIDAIGAELNQSQFDALCSFAYNLGAGIFKESPNLEAELRGKDWEAAGNNMLGYDHAGGVVLEGLKTRREKEVALFDEPVKEEPPKEEPKPVEKPKASITGVVDFKGTLNVETGAVTVEGTNSTVRSNEVKSFDIPVKIEVDHNNTKITRPYKYV